LLLQPLVENAVRHGIAPSAKPGRVDIRARRENNALQLEIEDDGCGLRQNLREGLGLKNTRARLEQLYGTAHKLELLPASSYETGALVRLTLPLKRENGPFPEGAA
jgi:LytS/YehU family sensor histidine kinase